MKDSIELLSESEDDCQIYANESRLKDFTRGVELARQELLRWRSLLEELPNNGKMVLIKPIRPHALIGTPIKMATYLNGRFWTDNEYYTEDRILGWRPIEEC